MPNSTLPAFLGMLFLLLTGVAQAELRDVTFAAEQKSAKILFTFDSQPDAVKVILTEQGMDVDVLGVSVSSANISAANPPIIESFRTISAPGGARIRFVLNDRVLSVNAEVYENSILVTARFARRVEPPVDALSFAVSSANAAKPAQKARRIDVSEVGQSVDNSPKKTAETKSKPHNASKHGHEAKPSKLSSDSVSGEENSYSHDGMRQIKRVPVQKPVGSGMIREASLRAAGSLTPRQCDESEQAVKADPWALDNLAKFGACLAVEGKSAEARQVFERLLTFDPETFAAYLGLGAIAQDAGEIATARQYYEEALSLGGTDAQAAQARSLMRSLGDE